MALYGASVGVAGVREASELGQNLQRIKDSSSLDSFLVSEWVSRGGHKSVGRRRSVGGGQ
eukprot:2173386-Rhodomonas_salina.1